MDYRWTLNIEGFGKIEKASFEISPLMVFTGDNNSGKSYALSLLWGILTMGLDIFQNEVPDSDTYKELCAWLEGHKDDPEFALESHVCDLFSTFFNEQLDVHKDDLVRKIFEADLTIGSISLTCPPNHRRIMIEQSPTFKSDSAFKTLPTEIRFRIRLDTEVTKDKEKSRYSILRSLCEALIFGVLCAPLFGGVSYLPASRTGFMLTYKTLAKTAVRHGFQSSPSESRSDFGKLTAPVSHFLGDLVALDFEKNSPYFPVAEFLEQRILQGKIEKDRSPVPNYSFMPDQLNQELSLHVTSSLVAEVSPIIVFLKSNLPITGLIIEEPEAHLHLDKQREMARALVRLVNMGLPVWITTHSDTMVQQINNLIKLNNNPQQAELAAKYGYEASDFLDAEKVNVYQFNTQPAKTEVQRLPLTDNGFAFPTFTESIMRLTQETLELMESDSDAEDDQ